MTVHHDEPLDEVLSLLASGPLNPVAEERAIPRLNSALRAEYERLFAGCKVRQQRIEDADRIIDRLVAARARYEALETTLGTPWYFVAVIHSLESGQRFDRHLHNGDPLTARTVHEPPGRPPRGRPPFTWEASAHDALKMKRLDEWRDWSVGGTLYNLEAYNGWGYRQDHPEVLSPYLWSFSRHYVKGKYVADRVFDPDAVSQQCGAAVLLRRMVDRGLITGWGSQTTGPLFRYSGGAVAPRGDDLQRFLNTLPGIELVEDGQLGPSTSQAVRQALGHLLVGDPRARGRDALHENDTPDHEGGDTSMAAQDAEGTTRGERLDWDTAELHPGVAGGFILVVRGVAAVPMTVTLHPLPVGIVPEDYRGIEVLGVREEATTQVETPWTAEIDTDGLGGRKGIVLIGAHKREYFPPRDEPPEGY
jgi:lysozyme family protein